MAVTARARRRDARRGGGHRGGGDRPAHAAPARPRHDPRVGAQDQPLRGGRGGLAARRRRRQPRRAGAGAGLRLPRRADPARHRRRRADAVLEGARAGRDAARGARGEGCAGDVQGRLRHRMAVDVTMPRLSDSMEEGTVLRWLKSVGDEVKRGDELVEIETDKANMTYEATDEGVAARDRRRGGRHASDRRADRADRRAGRSEPSNGEPPKREQPKQDGSSREPEPRAAAAGRSRNARSARRRHRPADGDGRVKASPVARRMARELNVELEPLQGSGPGGRIVKADVEAAAGGARRAAPRARRGARAGPSAAPTPETAKGEVQVVELTRLQATVARRMAESKATVPHFYLVDGDRHDRGGQAARAAEGDRRARIRPVPTFNDMVVKACARALREFPRANGSYRDGHVELYSRVNVGVAVAAQDALVVPTIFDADRKSLGEIAARVARAGGRRCATATITPPELSGGTFTVSNLGHVRGLQLLGRDQPAAGGAAGGRGARAEGGRRPRHAPRRGARHDGRHARLRPPHPVRRRRRAVPRRACATCSSSRSRWRCRATLGRTRATSDTAACRHRSIREPRMSSAHSTAAPRMTTAVRILLCGAAVATVAHGVFTVFGVGKPGLNDLQRVALRRRDRGRRARLPAQGASSCAAIGRPGS